jgi:excisionase family DNA binding protein
MHLSLWRHKQIQTMNRHKELSEINLAAVLHKPVLTFKEALLYTGLSESSLYKMVMNRLIPHSKPSGRKLYFNTEDLKSWMLSNPIATQDQLRQAAVNYTIAKPFEAGGSGQK